MKSHLIYLFDRYAVDSVRKTINKDGMFHCRDTKQVMLLYLLCKAHPGFLSKKEIMSNIWPGQVVTEASISRLIFDLRQTLGDDGKQQSFIKTEWGKGFRLTCQVQADTSNEKRTFSFLNNPLKLLKFVAVSMLLALAINFFWYYVKTDLPIPVENQKISLALAPVNVTTQDSADEWISLGVPSLISGLLQNYERIQTIPIRQTLSFMERSNIGYSRKSMQENFAKICESLGCSHLLYLEYSHDDQGQILSYSLYTSIGLTSAKDFAHLDVTISAEKITNHLSDTLLPLDEKRRSYTEFYSHDPMANRSYAIASNDRFTGNLIEAEANYKLALQRDKNFFWAKWGLATLYYVKNEWDLAFELLEELEAMAKDDPKKLGAIYQTRGSIKEAQGKITEAIELEKRAIKHHEKAGNLYALSNVKHNIGMALFDSGEIESGLVYLEESLKLDMESKRKTDIAISSFNVARAYNALNKKEKAMALFNQAKEHAIANNMALLTAFIRSAVIEMELEKGITTDRLYYEAQAVKKEFENLGHGEGALEATGSSIQLQRLRGELEDAQAAIQKHIESIDPKQYPQILHKSRYIAAQIYFDLKNYREALNQLSLVSGEWQYVDAERSLLEAKALNALGQHEQSIAAAEQVKMDIGKAWRYEHQLIYEKLLLDNNYTLAISE